MPLIEAKNIFKSYQQGGQTIPVLNNLNLSLEKGEHLAILGQSGSGKSTLLSLLSGLDQPDKGDICIQNQSLTALRGKKLTRFRAQYIGIVFQHFHLLNHLSAVENVELPLEIKGDFQGRKKAEDAIEAVGLKNRKTHFPYQLSGGEQQRVAIARALITNPDILLADEPSGNLDQKTGQKIMDLIFSQAKENHMSMILVTHNPELAGRCQHQLELKNGILC